MPNVMTRRERNLAYQTAKNSGAMHGHQAALAQVNSLQWAGFTTSTIARLYDADDNSVMPTLDLSGQWADEPTARDVFESVCDSIGLEVTLENLVENCHEVVDRYEHAFYESARVCLEKILKVSAQSVDTHA